MYKYLLLVAIAALLQQLAWAQTDFLKGTVKDEDGQPLIGATVQINELSKLTVTDEFGTFNFPKVPSGNYTITIRYLGYVEKSESVVVPSSPLQISLAESRQ